MLGLLMVRCTGKREGWLFSSKRAKGGHLTTVAKQFRKARSEAGLPISLVLYCARHTFGTAAYGATGNLAMVMNVMGHSDNAYRHAVPAFGVGSGARRHRSAESTSQTTSQRTEGTVKNRRKCLKEWSRRADLNR